MLRCAGWGDRVGVLITEARGPRFPLYTSYDRVAAIVSHSWVGKRIFCVVHREKKAAVSGPPRFSFVPLWSCCRVESLNLWLKYTTKIIQGLDF